MAQPTRPKTGVLVLRLWIEHTHHGFRARITEVADLEARDEVSHVAADVEEILRVVARFVRRFMRDAGVTVR